MLAAAMIGETARPFDVPAEPTRRTLRSSNLIENLPVKASKVAANALVLSRQRIRRSWNRNTLLVVPFPPSIWNGAPGHRPAPRVRSSGSAKVRRHVVRDVAQLG